VHLTSPDQEQLVMTLQVGFVAHDGFVIASDRKATSGFGLRKNPGASTANIHRAAMMRKIVSLDGSSLVCAFSGSDLSAAIAQKLVESAPQRLTTDVEIGTHLKRSQEFAAAFGKVPANEMIIAGVTNAPGGVHKLWRIFFFDALMVLPVRDKLYGGDEGNSAIFFGEMYYDPSHGVEGLVPLASHIILEGRKQNGLSVDGLDVLVAKDGDVPRFLSDAELDALLGLSEKNSREIANIVFRRRL
jgi:hypothetical protein